MDRNVVLGFVAGVIATCLLGWAVHGSPANPRPTTESHAPGPAPSARRIVPPQRHRRAVVEAEAPPGELGGTFEQVVRKIAEYSGDGVIRCDVGSELSDGPVDGLGRAWVEDGVLVGSVEDPQGTARIRLPGDAMSDEPRAIVKWSGAWPGETGGCSVLPAKRVLVSGTVVDSIGRPVPQAEVGNLIDGATAVAGGGRFTVLCWQGAECPLAARRSVSEPFGTFVTVVPDHPMSDVTVVLDQPPAQDLQDYLQERVAEDEQLEKQPDPLVLALADPTLPAETRPVIEGWLAEERDSRSVARALLAEVATR